MRCDVDLNGLFKSLLSPLNMDGLSCSKLIMCYSISALLLRA